MKKSKSLFALLSLMLVSAAAGCSSGPSTSSAIPSSNDPSSVSTAVPSSETSSFNSSPVSFGERGQTASFIGEPLSLDPVSYALSALPAEFNDPSTIGVIGVLVSSTASECIGTGNIEIKRFPFQYQDFDLIGNPVTLSGAITIPYLDGVATPKSIDLDSHPTFTDKSEAVINGPDIYSLLTCVGSIVIETDLLGFGVSEDKAVDYHCHHLSDRHSVDAFLAARALISKNLGIDFDSLPRYLTGYSQGGYNALSILRYLEDESNVEINDIINPFATYVGSGAYDLSIMFNDSLNKENFASPEFLLMGLLAAKSYHPEVFGSHSLDEFLTDYGKRFIEPVMNKDKAAIEALKAEVDESGNPLYHTPSDFFSEEFMENPESPLWEIANAYFEEENLLDGKWMPNGEVHFAYTVEDDIVSPRCTEKAMELFGKLPNVFFEHGYGSHFSYALTYYLDTLTSVIDMTINLD